MAKSIKLDALVLLRVVAEENHQEVFFGSMLGMETIIENNSVLLNSFKNNYFSEQNMDQLQVFNKGPIGTLEDYGSHLENELVELLNLNDFSEIINNGGVLLVIDETKPTMDTTPLETPEPTDVMESKEEKSEPFKIVTKEKDKKDFQIISRKKK